MRASEYWVVALGLAGAIALAITPLAARGPSHRVFRSSSAGLAIAVASVTLFLTLGDADAPLVVGTAAALCLWVVGALIDHGTVSTGGRAIALLVAAIAVTVSGLRVPVTGFDVGNAAATILMLYGAATAWRWAATRDGLLLAWAAALAAAAGTLGGIGEQHAVAAVAAGLVGACLGFSAYVLPPTVARLRTSGSLMIGFLAVVLALDVRPALASPRDAAIPLILLALPLLDSAFVLAARVRGRRVEPATSGLAGRLRALHLGAGVVAAVLVAFQLALGTLAVFAGRDVLPLRFAVGVTVAALAVLTVACLAGRTGVPRGRGLARLAVAGAIAVVVLAILTAPAAIALLRARDAARSGAEAARDGLAEARDGHTRAAARAFAHAQSLFADANRQLSGPIADGGLLVPVLSPNLEAARDLTDVGVDLARAGRRLTTTADPRRLRIKDGTLPLAELARLEPELRAVAVDLNRSSARLKDVERPFLAAPIDDAIEQLQHRLTKAAHDSRIAAEAARVLPAVLGGDGPRRYFLAAQNNAEARATGGFIANWGVITALDGKLELDQFEPVRLLNAAPGSPRTLEAPSDYKSRYSRFGPQRTWQNVNMSPDLPTVAAVMTDLLAQSGVAPVDGVVTIDPVGLAAVLRLTGPVTVPEWPEEISADNVVDVTLRQAYAAFGDNAQRDQFLGDVTDAVWHAFTSGDLGNPAHVLHELGRASHAKHLSVWLADPRAQRLVRAGGADGGLPARGGDLDLVTTQNAGANKLDLYLHRRIRYVVRLSPSASDEGAVADARLEVTMQNTAPGAGLPQVVLGPNLPDIGPGVNRSFVTVYSPFRASTARLDGQPTGLERQRELGYWAASRYVDVPPEATRTLAVDLAGTLRLRGGRYRLHVVRQPLAQPDDVEVVVKVPPGWRLVGGRALRLLGSDGRRARYVGKPRRDIVLTVRVVRS